MHGPGLELGFSVSVRVRSRNRVRVNFCSVKRFFEIEGYTNRLWVFFVKATLESFV